MQNYKISAEEILSSGEALKKFNDDAIRDYVTTLASLIQKDASITHCGEGEGEIDLRDKSGLVSYLMGAFEETGKSSADFGISTQQLRAMVLKGLKHDLEVWRTGKGGDSDVGSPILESADEYGFDPIKDIGMTAEEVKKLSR